MIRGIRVGLLTTVVLLLEILSAQAHAATGPVWTNIGAGCVPAGQTTQNALHFNTAGRAKFNVGKTGEIILTCPITANIGSANIFTMSYLDPDGPNSGAGVIATLRRMHRRTGVVSSVAAINSNANAAVSYGMVARGLGRECLGYMFDHANYDYYVQINLLRRSTLFESEFGAVSLQFNVC